MVQSEINGRRRIAWRLLPVLLGIGLLAAGLAACGSSGSSGTEAAQSSGGSTSAATSGSPSLAEAKAAIAPYVGKPSAFPVTETLERVPKGAHVIYVNCGAPDCVLLYEAMVPAAKALDINLTQIVAGASVQGVTSAFSTAVQEKPAAVIDPALDPVLWKTQLNELRSANIPVIGIQIPAEIGNGITATIAGPKATARVGKLQADYIYSQSEEETKAVFVNVPEFASFKTNQSAFLEELQHLCSSCQAESTSVTAASVGSTAPSDIVSYLQAHPETNWVVLPFDGLAQGLPQALSAAGLSVQIMGQAPTPVTLEYIKEGKETVAMASSQAFTAWMAMDATARSIIGQPLGKEEAFGQPPRQFLTEKDITFDPQEGWTPYPEYVERFEKLWGVR